MCRPSNIISLAARHVITDEEIVFGIRQHRTLGSLPFGFVGSRKKKFMVVATADLSKTMLMLASEFPKYTKGLTLRDLNETTANE